VLASLRAAWGDPLATRAGSARLGCTSRHFGDGDGDGNGDENGNDNGIAGGAAVDVDVLR